MEALPALAGACATYERTHFVSAGVARLWPDRDDILLGTSVLFQQAGLQDKSMWTPERGDPVASVAWWTLEQAARLMTKRVAEKRRVQMVRILLQNRIDYLMKKNSTDGPSYWTKYDTDELEKALAALEDRNNGGTKMVRYSMGNTGTKIIVQSVKHPKASFPTTTVTDDAKEKWLMKLFHHANPANNHTNKSFLQTGDPAANKSFLQTDGVEDGAAAQEKGGQEGGESATRKKPPDPPGAEASFLQADLHSAPDSFLQEDLHLEKSARARMQWAARTSGISEILGLSQKIFR